MKQNIVFVPCKNWLQNFPGTKFLLNKYLISTYLTSQYETSQLMKQYVAFVPCKFRNKFFKIFFLEK